MREETKSKIAIALVIFIFAAFICLMGYAIWQESSKPKMMLNKSDWECVKTETRITNVLVGKVIVPQSRQECIEYKRK